MTHFVFEFISSHSDKIRTLSDIIGVLGNYTRYPASGYVRNIDSSSNTYYIPVIYMTPIASAGYYAVDTNEIKLFSWGNVLSINDSIDVI